MPKTYLRYEPNKSIGIISSQSCNVSVHLESNIIVTGGVKQAFAWSLQTGERIKEFKIPFNIHSPANDTSQILAVSVDSTAKFVACGCESGNLFLFDFETEKLINCFFGHRKAINSINFNKNSTLFASTSKDTSIILWDILAQRALFKLKGHTDQVTDAKFMENDILISSSKDSMLKMWNLRTQQCVHTILGHRAQILNFSVFAPRRILSVTNHQELRMTNILSISDDQVDVTSKVMNGFIKSSKDKFLQVEVLKSAGKACFVGVRTKGKSVEVYRFRSEKEVHKKVKRRLQRLREKNAGDDVIETESETGPDDELAPFCSIKLKHEVKSFKFGNLNIRGEGKTSQFEMILSLKTNSIEIHNITFERINSTSKSKRKRETDQKLGDTSFSFVSSAVKKAISVNGHRSDIRCCKISSNDETLLTCDSNGEVKLWAMADKRLLGTIKLSGTKLEKYVLCCAFVPGDEFCLLGTKAGVLHIVDCSNFDLVRSIQAHTEKKSIWSLDINPNQSSFVTVSADKEAKFWDFDISDDKPLNVIHSRSLQMTDEILVTKYSHTLSQKHSVISLALLDNTVKVFTEQELKFKLSLYGHKLPVIAMDISTDDALLVSASADKNIKIWGLDFGDCHRSMFAHDLALTSVKFLPHTHQFFTAAKDGYIKYWDADLFQNITVIKSHASEIWGLDVTKTKSDNRYVVSVGNDRGINFFKRTQDIIFPEEEQQKLLEMRLNEDPNENSGLANLLAVSGSNMIDENMNADSIPALVAQNDNELAQVDKKDLVSSAPVIAGQNIVAEELILSSSEKLLQAIDFFDDSSVNTNKIILKVLKLTPTEYLLRTMREINASEVDQTLMLLPFNYSLALIKYLADVVEGQFNFNTEMVTKYVVKITKFNFKQLVANPSKESVAAMKILKTNLRKSLFSFQEDVGTNLAAMRHLKNAAAMDTIERI